MSRVPVEAITRLIPLKTHLMTYIRTVGYSLPPALWLAMATIASAQTGTSTATTTPGVPNTGAGGDPATLLAVLGIAALVAVVGGAYLLWERSTP